MAYTDTEIKDYVVGMPFAPCFALTQHLAHRPANPRGSRVRGPINPLAS